MSQFTLTEMVLTVGLVKIPEWQGLRESTSHKWLLHIQSHPTRSASANPLKALCHEEGAIFIFTP